MRSLLNLTLAGLLSGCSWLVGFPKIESKDVPAIMQAMAASPASACIWIGGRGGGGGGTITPLPIVPAGGYGSGEILFARVNAPDTKLTLKNGECTIERGPDKKGPNTGEEARPSIP